MAHVKKRMLDEAEIGRIRDTLDVIDISLYDLLVKRIELSRELGPAPVPEDFRALADSIRKITTARRLDPGALNITAGIIELANWSAGKIVVASADDPHAVALAGNFCPLFAGISHRHFSRLSDAAVFAAGHPDALALVPAKKTAPKDVWWMAMLSPEGRGARIVGRMPYADGTADSYYAVASAPDAWNFDRSVIAVATSDTVSPAWLKTALHKLEVPLYRVVDSAAVFNGASLHLVEISRPVSGPGDPIFKLDGAIGRTGVRFAGCLGGYFLPIVERGKIVEFNSVN